MITELNLVYFEGSALKHLQKKKLLTREFYLPNDQELEELNEIITPSLDMIGNNNEQNKQLSVIRNTLTSKFMSGTLNVDKIRAEEE